MKNKKIILQLICCAAAVTAFTVPVHAQITEKSCATKGQVVVFEGAADSAESLITYQVSEGNGGVFGGKELYYIGEKTTDENGGFKIEFSLEESGDYVLRMKDSAGDILDKPIKYLDEEDNGKILMEEINSSDDARIKKAIAAFDFSFDGKKYEELKTAAVENWLTECAKKKLPYADSTAGN